MHGFDERGIDVPRGRFVDTGRFGRMFPELRSLKTFEPGPAKLGAPGPAGGPPGPMEEPAGPPAQNDNPRIKAGYTFLGQFIDHDLTLDAVSILEQQVDIRATTNFRTPAFELDSLYGRGPDASNSMYDRTAKVHGTFLVEFDGKDLPRNGQETALIGDHRNDENQVISQLHTTFLRFHNRVLYDIVKTKADLAGANSPFEAAQKTVRWHYQWIVLNEFLPRTVGQEMVDFVLEEVRACCDAPPDYMPVEFSGAAYRFGHSQIRPAYAIRPAPATGGPPTIADIFPPEGEPTEPPAPGARPDLRGGRRLTDATVIDWRQFFGASAAQGKLIDTKLARPLLNLPKSVVRETARDAAGADNDAEAPNPERAANPAFDPHRSLATRNLQRGLDLRLPSGDSIARFLGITPLSEDELWDGVPKGKGEGPLWYYVLREAAVMHGGHHMGGVGAYIIAKTFVNLLLADRASFLWQHPGWTPTLVPGGKFTMADLVNLAFKLEGADQLQDEVLDMASNGAPRLPTRP